MAKVPVYNSSIVGNPAGARNNVRPVAIPDAGWGNVTKSAFGAMKSVGEFYDFVEKEDNEKNELDFNNKYNELVKWTQERKRALDNISGEALQGQYEAFYEDYNKKHSELGKDFSGKWAEQWMVSGGRLANQYRPSISAKVDGGLKKAKMESFQSIINAETENYNLTGMLDYSKIDNAIDGIYTGAFGRIVTAGTLSDMDKDFNDGDGFVKMVDRTTGELVKYRIVDKKDGKDPHTITKDEYAAVRERLGARAQEYSTFKRQTYEKIAAGRIDALLKTGDFASAYAVLDEFRKNPGRMSDKVLSTLSAAIEKSFDNHQIVQNANVSISTLARNNADDPNTFGGQFITAKDETDILSDIADLRAKGTVQSLKEADALESALQANVRARNAFVSASVSAQIDDWNKRGLLNGNLSGISQITAELDRMPNNKVKTELAKKIAGIGASKSNGNIRKQFEANANQVMYLMGKKRPDGSIPVRMNGQDYNLARDEDLKIVCDYYNVDPNAMKTIRDNPAKNTFMLRCADKVAETLNKMVGDKESAQFTGQYLLARGGGNLIVQVLNAAGSMTGYSLQEIVSNTNKDDQDALMKSFESSLLTVLRDAQYTKPVRMWGDTTQGIGQFIIDAYHDDESLKQDGENIPEIMSGLVVEKDGFDDFRLQYSRFVGLNPNSVEAYEQAQAALGISVTTERVSGTVGYRTESEMQRRAAEDDIDSLAGKEEYEEKREKLKASRQEIDDSLRQELNRYPNYNIRRVDELRAKLNKADNEISALDEQYRKNRELVAREYETGKHSRRKTQKKGTR